MAIRESQAVKGMRYSAPDHQDQSNNRRPATRRFTKSTAILSILAVAPTALAQQCVPLSSSTACPAFSLSSVSLSKNVTDLLYVLYPLASLLPISRLLLTSQPIFKIRQRYRFIRRTIAFIRQNFIRAIEVSRYFSS